MRILIFAMGSAGDVHPFLGLGRALTDRGHEVTVVASAFFEQTVIAAGLGFRPIGSLADYERLSAHPHLWHPRKALPAIVKHAVGPSYAPILEIVRELHVPGKTLLVASSLAFGARNARELLGIPLITIHLAPAVLPSLIRQPAIHAMPFGRSAPLILRRLQWRLAGKIVDHHVLPDLNRFRRQHGLPPACRMLHDWWHSPDRVIGLFPDWFAPIQADWPPQTRLTGFPLFDEKSLRPASAELREFLADGEPPVVFTPGSAMKSCGPFFREAVAALKITGRRGLLLTRYADQIPPALPPGIRHFPYIPFSEILPRAAALVYHGGIGTCAQALQAGIPHLIQPMAHDQHDNLSRVREMGVGSGLLPRHFKAREISHQLELLLNDPSVQKSAAAIATRFEPRRWLRETCELIETTRFSG